MLTNTRAYPESKPLSAVIPARRATSAFKPDAVPEKVLRDVLELAMMAPSGYNLQPWRFVVVRDPEVKRRLRQAAMGQPKVEEAPVVVACCGDPEAWKNGDMDEMIRMAKDRGMLAGGAEAALRKNAAAYLNGYPPDLWVFRQVMIAFTHLMLAAESYGLDTGPMEGFWEDKVREVLGIPGHVRVVALMALGYRRSDDKPYGGRFDLSRTVHWERYGAGVGVG